MWAPRRCCSSFCVNMEGLKIAMAAPDTFGSLLAAGITAMIAIQALTNIAVVTGSIPVTGITLPLISAGGVRSLSPCAAWGCC